MGVVLAGYAIRNLINLRQNDYTVDIDSTTIPTSEFTKKVIRFGDFEFSMNLFIQVSERKGDINPLDNEYFELRSYIVD